MYFTFEIIIKDNISIFILFLTKYYIILKIKDNLLYRTVD